MLFFGVLPLLLAAASAENCYKQMVDDCGTHPKVDAKENCIAVYGQIEKNLVNLQGFANANLEESFHLLLISSYFGNYHVSRDGFKKLYRKYSDKLWEDSIDIMKYISKRGGAMNFKQPSHFTFNKNIDSLTEIQSLALVLDKQKELANKAFKIHINVLDETDNDPAIAHYIEERFLEAHTDRIRDLSGYITELKALLHTNYSSPESIFVFDEYLQKSL